MPAHMQLGGPNALTNRTRTLQSALAEKGFLEIGGKGSFCETNKINQYGHKPCGLAFPFGKG